MISKFLIKVINSGDLDCQAEISPVFRILPFHICYVIAIQIKLCINYMGCQYMVFYIALKKNNHWVCTEILYCENSFVSC